MRVVAGAGRAGVPAVPEAGFEGLVGLEDLSALMMEAGIALPAEPIRTFLGSFVSGAATRWHTHGGGQLIIGIEGSGFVEAGDGSKAVHMEAGTIVLVMGGERHRHGARPGSDFSHLTITVGTTDWE